MSMLHVLFGVLGGGVLTVELADKLHAVFNGGGSSCTCNVRVSSDGDYYESDASGGYGLSDEAWLEAGSAGDVWLERTITSGTLDTDDVGTGRVNLGSGDYNLGVTAPDKSTDGAEFTLDFYDASSGGTLLDTADINVSADATSF